MKLIRSRDAVTRLGGHLRSPRVRPITTPLEIRGSEDDIKRVSLRGPRFLACWGMASASTRPDGSLIPRLNITLSNGLHVRAGTRGRSELFERWEGQMSLRALFFFSVLSTCRLAIRPLRGFVFFDRLCHPCITSAPRGRLSFNYRHCCVVCIQSLPQLCIAPPPPPNRTCSVLS